MDEELKEKRFASFIQNPHRDFRVIIDLSQYRYFRVMATDGAFNSS